MKPHERRRIGAYPYYSLSEWNDKMGCYLADKRRTFETEAEAKKAANKPGKYRITKVSEYKREDLKPFIVT